MRCLEPVIWGVGQGVQKSGIKSHILHTIRFERDSGLVYSSRHALIELFLKVQRDDRKSSLKNTVKTLAACGRELFNASTLLRISGTRQAL